MAKGAFRFPFYSSGGGDVYPDPMVYCPANGFTDTPYVPDPDLYPMPGLTASGDEILLTVADAGTKPIYMTCSVSGNATVYVYGANQELVYTWIATTGTINFSPPWGEGYNNGGRSSFLLKVVPTIPSNSILTFSINMSSGTNQYYEAILNCPSLTGAYNMFYNSPTLRYADISRCGSIVNLGNGFKYCGQLQVVKMPDEMPDCTSMSDCFYRCYTLTGITLPSDLSSLKTMDDLFRESGILDVTFPALPACTTLYYSFYNCKSIRTISFSSDMNDCTTWYQMCGNCSSLRSITLPTSLDSLSIMQNAFTGCISLGSISLPAAMNSLTTMASTFYNCSSLYNIDWPEEASSLNNLSNVCYNCISLLSVTLLYDFTVNVAAFNQAFRNCASLASVTLPSSFPAATTLDGFIAYSKAITSLTIPDIPNCTDIDNLLNQCTALTILTLPSSLPSVQTAGYWLDYCTALTSISTATWSYTGVKMAGSDNIDALTSFYQPTLRPVYLALYNSDNLATVEVDWANSPWANNGSYPAIDISGCNIGTTELDRIMTALPTVSTGTILKISNNPGYASCDVSIAIAKNWTVT